jgi:hypothetical protein
MMHKHSIAIHKPWPNAAVTGTLFHGIVAKLRNAIRIEIPTGYQDETGFHRGVKPVEKEVKWPSVW